MVHRCCVGCGCCFVCFLDLFLRLLNSHSQFGRLVACFKPQLMLVNCCLECGLVCDRVIVYFVFFVLGVPCRGTLSALAGWWSCFFLVLGRSCRAFGSSLLWVVVFGIFSTVVFGFHQLHVLSLSSGRTRLTSRGR